MTRVLVVDPDVARRSMIRGRIADAGHGALTAVNAEEGLAAVETVGVDLVLLSTDIGGGGGADEMCEQLKAEDGYPPSVIIYQGAESAMADAAGAFAAGCDRFVFASELATMELVVAATLQSKVGIDAVREHNRMLELERQSLVGAEDGANVRRDHVDPGQAAGRPDAVFIIDSEGTVLSSDAGAHRIFGKDHEGRSLDDLAPGRGLQAHIRDARCAAIEGLRFDLPGRGGRPARHFQASVYPLHASSPKEPQGMRVILFVDIGRRVMAGDLLRGCEEGLTDRQVANMMETAARAYGPHTIEGDSLASQALRAAVIASAGRNRPLLVVGPRGTRRRNIARAVHFGVEAPGSFLFMHCASLSTESLETEFFGCGPGEDAGRKETPRGLLSLAAGGTLVLEEIEVLPLTLQDRLGEAMSAGSFRTQGARELQPLEARIIATSVHDHATLRKRGLLSPALLAALGDGVIQVPTVAERCEDLPIFSRRVLDRIAGRETSKLLASEVQWLLQQHAWPENFDELEASLRRACGRARGDRIGIEHLDGWLRRLYADLTARGIAPLPRAEGSPEGEASWPASSESALREWDVSPEDPISFDAYERKAILRALAACGGDKQGVARLLNVGKSTLYRKLNRLGI